MRALTVPGAEASRSTQADRERLLELLRTHSFERKDVLLASGKRSDFFIDCKQTVLSAEAHVLVGRLMCGELSAFDDCEAVAGVELGGCSLASAVALVSYLQGRPKNAVYVRKDQKDHGSRRLLEGVTQLNPGASLLLVEDVITTGGSTLKAAAKIRDAGFQISGVLALVDRLEGGREAIEANGLRFAALYTRFDFIPDV